MIISIKELRNFFICVLIPLVVGYTSNLISKIISGIDIPTYYSQLIKPSFAPPGFIFGIVWTILYVLMGISSFMILNKGYTLAKIKDAMFYYWTQLALNFIWPILFFGLDLRLTAFVDLILLLIILIIMILKFYKIDKKAAFINLPYLVWVIYAGILNYFIWYVNR